MVIIYDQDVLDYDIKSYRDIEWGYILKAVVMTVHNQGGTGRRVCGSHIISPDHCSAGYLYEVLEKMN